MFMIFGKIKNYCKWYCKDFERFKILKYLNMKTIGLFLIVINRMETCNLQVFLCFAKFVFPELS